MGAKKKGKKGKGKDDVSAEDAVAVEAAKAAKELKEKQERIEQLGESLRDAVRAGEEDKLPELIADGASINWADPAGWAPLHYACRSGHQNIASLLISMGASVAPTDSKGMSPLLYAARNGHTVICKLLYHAGADIHSADEGDNTALHYSCMREHEHVVTFLIQAKADVNAQEGEGKTPLHLVVEAAGGTTAAAQNIVRALVAAGADGVGILDRNGFAAEDCCSSAAMRACLQYLTPGRSKECAMKARVEASAVFKVLDADGSGSLSVSELAQNLEAVGGTEKALRALFAHIDKEGDGLINREEFIEYFTEYSQYLYRLPEVMRLRKPVPPSEAEALAKQRTQEKGADKAFYSPADWGYVSKEELKQREIESKEAARMVQQSQEKAVVNKEELHAQLHDTLIDRILDQHEEAGRREEAGSEDKARAHAAAKMAVSAKARSENKAKMHSAASEEGMCPLLQDTTADEAAIMLEKVKADQAL